MNVLVDGRWDGDTGIGRLYREVISRAPEIVTLSYIDTDFSLGSPKNPFYLANKISNAKPDVFYSPSYMPPSQSKIPFVITIHDLNHLYYYTKFHKFYLKYIIGYLASKSKRIITVSNYSKNEIVRHLKIHPDKIAVIYNGVDIVFSLNADEFSLNRPYFLYVGNRRSYKNIRRMLKAFSEAKISNDYLLAMSGFIDNELEQEIRSLGIFDRVIFLGVIDEADLPKIYKGAFALIFVSLMEGFGLPVLEAMASGTPVITSNVTSLPEISGDAALLVDPLNVKSISIAITSLTQDKSYYNELVANGLKRSKVFNWKSTADQTWDVILK